MSSEVTTTGYGYNRQILQGILDSMHTSSLCVGYSQKEVCSGGINIKQGSKGQVLMNYIIMYVHFKVQQFNISLHNNIHN